MKTVNTVVLVGFLGHDPSIRTLDNGTKLARFSLATGNGDRTEWHPVVAFNQTAELVEKYLHKGSKVYVAGRLTHRKWMGKDNNPRSEGVVIVHGLSFFSSKHTVEEDDVPFDPESIPQDA